MISADDYVDIVVRLLSHHYRFTTIDCHSVLHQLKKDDWRITPTIFAFARQIACRPMIPTALCASWLDLAQTGWGQKARSRVLYRLLAAMIRAQREAQPNWMRGRSCPRSAHGSGAASSCRVSAVAETAPWRQHVHESGLAYHRSYRGVRRVLLQPIDEALGEALKSATSREP